MIDNILKDYWFPIFAFDWLHRVGKWTLIKNLKSYLQNKWYFPLQFKWFWTRKWVWWRSADGSYTTYDPIDSEWQKRYKEIKLLWIWDPQKVESWNWATTILHKEFYEFFSVHNEERIFALLDRWLKPVILFDRWRPSQVFFDSIYSDSWWVFTYAYYEKILEVVDYTFIIDVWINELNNRFRDESLSSFQTFFRLDNNLRNYKFAEKIIGEVKDYEKVSILDWNKKVNQKADLICLRDMTIKLIEPIINIYYKE